MSRPHRHERRHHRDDIEDRYQEEEEEEEDDRRHRGGRDEDRSYRHNRGYRDYDEERSEVERAPSDRAVSEFILDTPRYDPDEQERYDTDRRGRNDRERYDRERYDRDRDRYDPDGRDESEIYAEAHQPDMSHYASSRRTHQSGVSDAGTTKTKTSRHGNLMMETMAAPHPCCPNTKGVCCLMLLLNLAILLIALGFVIILQLFNPPFVWFIGLALLIGGFCALIFCLVYCVWVCKDAHRAQENGELYWTHHWQKQWGYQPSEKEAPSEPYRERY